MGTFRDILSNLRTAATDAVRGAPAGLGRADDGEFDPFESNGLVVRCHARWPDDPALLNAWDALAKSAADATAFHSPAWQSAAFVASGAQHLRLITVHSGDQLLAVLPMHLNAQGGVVTIGAALTDYLDPLVAPAAAEGIWPAVLAFLASQWDRRTVEVTFHNLRESANARTTLLTLGPAAGFTCEERVVEHCPAIALPKSWDAYLASLDAHERKETRRKLNKAETKGNATLVRCAPGPDLLPTLDLALRLMESSGGEKATAIQKYIRPLLTAAAPPLIASGQLDLLTLHINGDPAACLVQFPHATGPMLYNVGYDATKKEWSPGVVAVAMSIRRAIEQGAERYDLLRGREPYKYRLGATDRPLYRLTLRRA